MNSRSIKVMILPLIGLIGFLLNWNVYAQEGSNLPKSVRFVTTVVNWQNNNDLRFDCGSATSEFEGTVTPRVYYGVYEDGSVGTLSTASCNFTLASLGMTASSNFQIIEEYDFTNYVGTVLEFENMNITPGKVTSTTVNNASSDAYGAYFSNYIPSSSEVAVLYNMNLTNSSGDIIGGHYVSQAYLQDEEEDKISEKSFGVITIPTYCIRMNLKVRGNIANSYGAFTINALGQEFTNSPGNSIDVCTINGELITAEDIDNFSHIDVEHDIAYTGVARANEYVKSIESLGESTSGSEITNEFDIVATLNATGSQTGLVYRLLPFLLLIGLVAIGYVYIRKNSVRS